MRIDEPQERSDAELHFQSAECVACRRETPEKSLDNHGWCVECRPVMRRRVTRGRHLVAALVTLPFAVWVLTLDRGATLSQSIWLLPLAAAYYLGLRIGREVVRAYTRLRPIEYS